MYIVPAQVLKQEVRIMCEFRIYIESGIAYSRKSMKDLIFSIHQENTNGIDNFIDSRVYEYLDDTGKLNISAIISTDIGPSGELIGYSDQL